MNAVNTKTQIDRLLFFSDAVIAIAITLLIIEIKAPVIGELSTHEEKVHVLNELLPKFISFLIGFFVIAIYWKSHHYLFGFITGYTDKLIWINTLFLLSIVLMPFSSAFYSENFSYNIAYAVYCLNIIMTGLLNCWLVMYLSNSKSSISTVAGNTSWRRHHISRSLVAPATFLLSLLISFYSVGMSRLAFLVIFPVIFILNRRYKKERKPVKKVTTS